MAIPLLAPVPRRLIRRRGSVRIRAPIDVHLPALAARDRRRILSRLAAALSIKPGALRAAPSESRPRPTVGKRAGRPFTIAIRVTGGGVSGEPGFAASTVTHPDRAARTRAQSYRLTIDRNGIDIAAPAESGVHHALATLAQVALASPGRLPRVDIRDAPDIPVRGVMLDISRDKVPRLSTLLRLIDWLSGLKINQLQLYTEHTFAYRRHRTVWKDASPLTAAEIRRLDRFCRDRGIELVPNQNCFGHMERWLKHPRYRPLAETTRPWRDPWGRVRTTPSTLCPVDPRSLRLVTGLLDELLPCFTSGQVNVGCDETFELGQGRSRAACRRRGAGRVYLDYLLKLHRHVRRRGRRMQFWADIIHQHPDLIRRLPRDVIPIEWGYEADHPFDARCRALRRAGLEFYVCPGTSSWCSFAGRTSNALANLAAAARAARRHRALGYLVADWGDGGHRQQLPVSFLPILFGAAAGWNTASSARLDVARAASLLALGDLSGRAGRAWRDLGDLHMKTGVAIKNQALFYRVMQAEPGELITPRNAADDPLRGVRPAAVQDMIRRLTRLCSLHPPVRSKIADTFTQYEWRQSVDILRHAALRMQAVFAARAALGRHRDRNPREAPALRLSRPDWQRLAADLRRIIASQRRIWLRRNRPGGLRDSLAHFRRNLDEYRRAASAAPR